MMPPIVSAMLAFLGSLFQSCHALHLKILALQHQVAVYQRSVPRPRLRPTDRLFWSWLARLWAGWQEALAFVQPRTVIAWHRKRFRDHWRRLSHRHMSQANPTWGAPRIIGELRKLGIAVAQSTVEKYRVRPRKPLSPTWMTFLQTHVQTSFPSISL